MSLLDKIFKNNEPENKNTLKKNPALTYLRVKIKSLAVEARIIRTEERKAKARGERALLDGLHTHRIFDVRIAARRTLLAYGYLRGKSYREIERVCNTPLHSSDIKSIARMIVKYGPEGWYAYQSDERINEAYERTKKWIEASK